MIKKLLPIFQSVFDDDSLVLYASTTASDIDGWDSLAHIRLIVAIEKLFKVRFSAAEIVKLQNVGDMINLISKKKEDA
jgi:acyl carrier protein